MVKSTCPGGVDDVDVVVVPLAMGGGGGDGDPALALQLHRVHLGAHAVLALDVVDHPDALGIEQHALGEGGLPRIDVRADPDVTNALQVRDHGPVLWKRDSADPIR
jgi:hypothetical protein